MVANRLRDAAAVLEVDSAYRRDAAIMREAADEVDRLRHDIERHVEIACELATECERLRAELAVEHKRQTSMRNLIAALEGQLAHYRSKQEAADEAVRTLDSERAANATLTVELAGMEAQRMAYAREFSLTAEGEPDTGNIHANIRAMKAELAACKADAERYRWLRNPRSWPAVFSGAEEPEPVTGETLDSMVDYVRKGEV